MSADVSWRSRGDGRRPDGVRRSGSSLGPRGLSTGSGCGRVTHAAAGVRAPVPPHAEFFLIGDYRSGLLDLLRAVADADPSLICEDWVAAAVGDAERLLDDRRVTLVKNYGRKLIDPVPFETVGEPSRFLTYEWLTVERAFGSACPEGADHLGVGAA